MPTNYQIRVHTADGRQIWWRKQGQIAILPEELAETWVGKFRTDLWEISPEGEMLGAGRGSGGLKILKVEKIPAEIE